MKTRINLFGTLLLVAFVTMGAKLTTDNTAIIGDGNPANDKLIDLSDGQIKWDSATSKLQFSNDDGLNFTQIGSGGNGGGGINLFTSDDNPGFEQGDPPSSWTNSGATFAAELGSPGFGSQSGSWDASATSQTLDSALKAVPSGLEDRHCTAGFQYKWLGNAGDLKFQVIDSGASLLAEKDIIVTTDWQKEVLAFDCPSGESIRIRIISTADAAVLLIDEAEIGQSNLIQISQTQLVAHAHYANTANCVWGRTSATLGDFAADSDCPAITVDSSTQAVDTADNDLPDIDFDSLVLGNYLVEVVLTASHSGATLATDSYRLSDGTTNGAQCASTQQINTDEMSVACSMVFSSISGAVNFKLQGATDLGTDAQIVNDAQGTELVWKVWKIPGAAVETLTFETTALSWSGYHDSTCQWSRTNTALGDPADDASCNLVESTNTGFGVVAAVGSTGPAISFTPKRTGNYYVCVNATLGILTAGANANVFMSLTDGTTVIADADREIYNGGVVDESSTTSVCGIYSVTSLVSTIIKIQTAADANAVILGSISGGTARSSIEWTIFAIDQQFPAPVFTELENKISGRESGLIEVSALILNSGTPTVDSEFGGNWVDSLTDHAVGQTSVNIAVGIFSQTPHCFLQGVDSEGSPNIDTTTPISSTVVRVLTEIAASGTDSYKDFYIKCRGK